MKTVFVIGAGASKEIGMPTGKELTEKISALLKVKNGQIASKPIDDSIRYYLSDCGEKVAWNNPRREKAYRQAAETISSGLLFESSIDSFLHKHSDNTAIVSCGKLAITLAIRKAERESCLYAEPSRDTYRVKPVINADKLKDTWYTPCFQKITENCVLKDISERLQNIIFVIFNYDRCFE